MLKNALDNIVAIKASWAWRFEQFVAKLLQKMRHLRRTGSRSDRATADILRASPLFDAQWYLERYHDVEQSKIEPALHYATHGWREGRNPSAKFDAGQYLKANADVAAAGINPLLHFLEHGQIEGREVIGHAPTAWPKSTETAGPAHDCVRYPKPKPALAHWIRSAMLRERDDHLLYRSAQRALGYIDPKLFDPAGLDALITVFRVLSGVEKPADRDEAATERLPLRTSQAAMIADAWMLNDTTIRTRWRTVVADHPIVIRGYQIGGDPADEICLCGEAVVYGPLDCIDLALDNAFAPLLIIEAETDGRLRGATLLPFPSLCRGGVHYGELLALHDRQAADNGAQPDLLELSHPLVLAMDALSRGKAEPLVGQIRVDLRGAGGTEMIFRPDLQQWLRRSFGIALTRSEIDAERDDDALHYLDEALYAPKIGAHTALRGPGLWLDLPASSVPTLQMLVAHAPTDDAEKRLPPGPVALSHICADIEPTAIKHVIELPRVTAGLIDLSTDIVAPCFPRLVSATPGKTSAVPALADTLIAAIRFPDPRPRHQADCMMPVAKSVSPLMSCAASPVETSVVIAPSTWSAEWLLPALATLQAQQTEAPLSLILLASNQAALPAGLDKACDSFFAGRWQVRSTMAAPDWQALANRNVMIVGPDILVHDSRTIAALSALVADEAVATADCVIVHATEATRGWSVFTRSAGAVIWAGDDGDATVQPLTDMALLPRTTYPVAATGTALWMARASWLAETGFSANSKNNEIGSPVSNPEQLRLCTSLISASSVTEPLATFNPSRIAGPVPPSLRIRVLHG